MDKNAKTEELMKRISRLKSQEELEEMMVLIQPEKTFSDYFDECLEKMKKTKAEVIKDANIDRNYGYQMLDGRVKQPGRDKIIALGISAGLSCDEIRRLLKLAKQGDLYSKNPRDATIIFGISQGLNVININTLLDAMKESILE